MDVVKFEQVENKILSIRNEQVLLDIDVARLYWVETKRINEAVKNNLDKFPAGYIIEFNERLQGETVWRLYWKLKCRKRGWHGFTWILKKRKMIWAMKTENFILGSVS